MDGVQLARRRQGESGPAEKGMQCAQDFDLTAPDHRLHCRHGHILQHAVTSGAAQITIAQAPERFRFAKPRLQKTVVTAGKFDADLRPEGRNRLASLHGAPDARIVNSSPPANRIASAPARPWMRIFPQGGIDSVTQTGQCRLYRGQGARQAMQAWANAARYTPGGPDARPDRQPAGCQWRNADDGEHHPHQPRDRRRIRRKQRQKHLQRTERATKWRSVGLVVADSCHCAQHDCHSKTRASRSIPGKRGSGRMRTSSSHPRIQFDRDHRSVTAQGLRQQPVQTILMQSEKSASKRPKTPRKAGSPRGRSSPITITGQKLTYADSERRVHYEGGVIAKGADFTALGKIRWTLSSCRTAKHPVPQSFSGSRATRSHGGGGGCGHPTAQPASRGPKACLYGGGRQVCPDRRTCLAFLMPNKARLPGFR